MLSLRFRTDKTLLLSLRFRTDKTLLLSLRFRTEQSFLGASDEPLGGNMCFLRESEVLTKRQQQDVDHEGIVTGRDALSLRSFSGGSGSTLAHRKASSLERKSPLRFAKERFLDHFIFI
ncbi:hypothetical protein [Lysinibacillus xylanilyticus]|uniref:hypothetical protein n=1 Tax=Lysinibacillus xylanilyticus TaxID=582475 RepID=UPI003CFE5410